MAYFDAVYFLAAASGTGDFGVASAVQGYRTPADASVPNGAVGGYRAESSDLTQWEIGAYTYSTTGPTVVRSIVLSNSLGTTAKINFTGAPNVGFVELAQDLVNASLLLTGTVGTARLGSGTANSGTFLRGDSTWQAVVVPVEATQAEMEAATNTIAMVTPRRVKNSPFAAKAWCKWGVTTTIDASAGVSSITDNGAGDWTVNWSTAFSSVNYVVQNNYEKAAGGLSGTLLFNYVANGGQATGSVRINTVDYNVDLAPKDPMKNYVVAFGDQ